MKTLDGRARARRGDARARAPGGPRGRRACSPTWTSRSGAPSGTRSRSARRSRRCAARGRPTSPELVLDACARLLALLRPRDRRRGGPAARRGGRRRRVGARRPTSAGSARRAATRIRGALPEAPVVRAVVAPRDGVVDALGALAVGIAALELGAGRRTKADPIDHAVGVALLRQARRRGARGRRSRRGACARRGDRGRGRRGGARRVQLGDEAPPRTGILLDVIGVSRPRSVAGRAVVPEPG